MWAKDTLIWKLSLEGIVEAPGRVVIVGGLLRVGGWTTTIQPCGNAVSKAGAQTFSVKNQFIFQT